MKVRAYCIFNILDSFFSRGTSINMEGQTRVFLGLIRELRLGCMRSRRTSLQSGEAPPTPLGGSWIPDF